MRVLTKLLFIIIAIPVYQFYFESNIADMSGVDIAASAAWAASLDEDDWLEPKGLNIIDLVGEIPDEYLRDAIVSFVGGAGISQYESGIRSGDVVTVTYRVTPNYQTFATPISLMSCPSYQGFSDHWPVPMPKATARFFAKNIEITNRIYALQYHPAGLFKPSFGSTTDRYPFVTAPAIERTDAGAVVIPGNMGCTLFFDGAYSDVHATYVYEQPRQVRVRLLGQDRFQFRSYIGPGEAGLLASLQEQLSQFGDRHDKFLLNPPRGTEYILVNYPPTPVGPYVSGDVETNIRLPSSGTYRLAAGIVRLSSDHYVSFAMPLQGQWQDADQAGFLYLSRLTGINILTSPEYFVPAGVAYDPCMRYGACDSVLLDRILNGSMHLSVYYLSVERNTPNLHRYPLRQVGPGWVTDAQSTNENAKFVLVVPATMDPPPHRLHIPVIRLDPQPIPDDPTGCPCGWFSSDGRMFDFTPRQE